MLCLTLESGLVSFIRGELEINRLTFLQIFFTSIFTAALAPLLLVPLRLISPDRDQDDDMETVQRINR